MLPLLTNEELSQLPPDGGSEYNRLIFEKSPYLLQHARNPVKWWSWCDEAFETARAEDKPVFLSIGYATCHWCHVMEHESFEDVDIASAMNASFICVKVDREERPDIDHVYMAVTQAMTGHGGWPMTVLMTWDKKPFFTGTYFPKRSRHGRIGMHDLIKAINDAWLYRKDDVLTNARQIVESVSSIDASEPKPLRTVIVSEAVEMFKNQFDQRYAGFGNAPKFPTPHNISFLLRYYHTTHDADVLQMVVRTLDAMRWGGIYDHIGFGFHRYSTDARWFLPHFEKMLYDQALTAIAYTEAYQITGYARFKETAQNILEYVLRDMEAPSGGFYSAEDADSDGEEGKFYLWSFSEIAAILGTIDAELFAKVYNLDREGNYYDEATREPNGSNIIFLTKEWSDITAETGITEHALREQTDQMRKKLLEVRSRRTRPLKDDKILTDWNGLMITALCKAAQVFEDATYVHAAMRAEHFIRTRMMTKDGHLYKRHRLDESGLPAHLDDYAFWIWGLIELVETTGDVQFLKEARRLTTIVVDEFEDPDNGGFYFTSQNGEPLIRRTKELYDGAIPSGNSVMLSNLYRMSRLLHEPALAGKAERIGLSFADSIHRMPMAFAQFLSGWDRLQQAPMEIIITGTKDNATFQVMSTLAHHAYHANKTLIIKSSDVWDDLSPQYKNYPINSDYAKAYVCRDFHCEAPVSDKTDLQNKLRNAP
ncbi:MAG TPA: thioredoxin domain-containing protein [bacterium]|nr:thioredoxin domain-containing protein [bacterium]